MERKEKIFVGTVRKLFNDFVDNQQLVCNGDKVLCAISGGKDSMALLHLLAHRKKYLNPDFYLVAVYVHVENAAYSIERQLVEDFCESIDVPFVYNPIILNDLRNGENRCFICSTARRSALFSMARKLGCNKIAFGHNMDDVVETFLLNSIFHGRNETFKPKTILFDGEITLVRPLMNVSKLQTAHYSEVYNFPKTKTPCGFENISMRYEVRKMLDSLNNLTPAATKNLYKVACTYMQSVNNP